MERRKLKIENKMRFFPAMILLFAAINSLAAQQADSTSSPRAEPSEADKAAILREAAENWIQAGIVQMNRGLYERAQESFSAAQEYQEYLPADAAKGLQENIDKARQGVAERKTVLEYLARARDLLNRGQPIEARAQYEKVRNSPYLTEQEHKQIAGELKTVDAAFDRRRMEITEVYNRSVSAYRAGDLENARAGFVEVAKSGILIAPKGQTAEDYLVQIDNILTEQFKPPLKPAPAPAPKPAQAIPPPLPEEKPQESPQTLQEQLKEVEAAVETTPQTQAETEAYKEEARTKIIRGFTKTVVDDAMAKVEQFISRGEFDKALAAVRSAAEIVGQNRLIIGDGAFAEYAIRLKRATEKIVAAHKSS